MSVINVNPTRMEMNNLKKKLVTAIKGHRLLKDKRDELMRQFMDEIKECSKLRYEVEETIKAINTKLAIINSLNPKQVIEVAFMNTKQELSLEIEEKNVMSVKIPQYKTNAKYREGSSYSYSFFTTPWETDECVAQLNKIFPKMLTLAQKEKACLLMASEIEKTRRRVNALEHIMLPRYKDTIRFISMKLEENERSTIARLMKVNDIIL